MSCLKCDAILMLIYGHLCAWETGGPSNCKEESCYGNPGKLGVGRGTRPCCPVHCDNVYARPNCGE